MSNESVYVVRHFSYDYHEFESLIGLAATKEVAERMARNNEHVYNDEPVIIYSGDEHRRLACISQETSHVYIEIMEIKQ